ncbi:YigZ family protein [Desertivirga xinjiangensis]|uniref:YigZ family protein n=1 Tax=Desertivirga xinjiangensis TaxID=539206 RepID=UPI00210B3F33|nr:YigZ family protein [Pedobacter xinjiangensis]
MLFDNTYKTIEKPSEGIFRDKGSKFITYAYPIKTEEQAKTIIQQVRAQHPKARHHCWAMRLSSDRSIFRLNDDGEPSGTAGRPILNTLLSNDLTNILIIVVRYFGGTLLGVPGLINAYKEASADAIKSANVIQLTVNDIYSIEYNYVQMNEVMRIIKDSNLNILKQWFESECVLQLEIPKSKLNLVLPKLQKIESLKTKYLFTV